jgi:hypothetical protein
MDYPGDNNLLFCCNQSDAETVDSMTGNKKIRWKS